MKRVLRNLLTVAATAMFAWVGHAQASVVVTGTRVIYPANEREVTIRVNNVGKTPSLVQAWLDTGEAGVSPDKIDVPFTLTPAMFRLDPTKGQTMRLIYSQAPLPTDKETMYWLNVLEIPPKAKPGEADASQLQLAFRTRIKVFFRPVGLPGQPEQAPGQVKWQVVHKSDGYHLKGTNPTPYFVNYGGINLVSGGQTLDAGGGYIAPGESAEFPVTGLKGAPKAGAQVRYSFLNDFGASVSGEAPATGAPAN
ncbi:fimbrial biogenesis chaperone [Paraburkholderia dinghuensis]|uniref:Molecular chaperone n=1 Tax=Paraburkholderia dinghuensis TaxID=2305225 RepID=A0A3N6MJI9_9BURK|nr:fimbria/pilus periplasmic chaperone [Paraburkholderia dinghuensis]RQH03598.1 molecular chaperone [Paraburkholderia dinghuensis]